MKKLSLLFVGLFLSFYGVMAHGNYSKNSEIELRTWNNAPFQVIFDHQAFAKTNNFGLKNIVPGIHYLEVVQYIPNKFGNGGLKRVLYAGNIKIPRNSEVKAMIKPNKKLDVKIKPNHHYSHGNVHQTNCGHNQGYSCACQINQEYTQNNEWGSVCQTGSYYQPFPMGNIDFNQLLNVVNNKNFDDEKLLIVQQAIKSNYFKTEQVDILMSRLTFDSYKLKLAKSIYPKVLDPNNFYLVNDQFAFNSSVRELNDYLNNMG